MPMFYLNLAIWVICEISDGGAADEFTGSSPHMLDLFKKATRCFKESPTWSGDTHSAAVSTKDWHL